MSKIPEETPIDDVIALIGTQIKEIRREKGLTIQDLSELSGISKGMLSKIENGRTIPSLNTLALVTKSLHIDLSHFFNGIENYSFFRYILKRENEYQVFEREESQGFLYQFMLSRKVSDLVFESVILELAPGANRKKISTDAYEFKYILEGQVEYHIGEEVVILQKGDSLFFDGRIPHVPLNPFEETVRILVIYLMLPQEKAPSEKS
ncbi:MAG: helix-turn-helix domain-containing protein [Microscillaceae bacterium]|nr:helix-turn-helix domain-containing protein [Microscillaceae bacterium]